MHFPSLPMEEGESGNWIAVVSLVAVELVRK